MKRPFKTSCLALLTVLSLTAVHAPTSPAEVPEFKTEAYPAEVEGHQSTNHVMVVEGSFELVCKQVTVRGTLNAVSETIQLEPTYAECTIAGAAATVNANGCTYKFHIGSEVGVGEFSGTTDIACPSGKAITATAGTCEVLVGSQAGLSKVEYVNNSEAEVPSLTGRLAITGLKYTTKDGFLCPFSGSGEKTNGTYAGAALVEAKQGAQKLAAGVAHKTKLCKVQPKVFCPQDQVHGPQTLLEATSSQEISIEKDIVNCTQEKIVATTEKNEGAPLMLENYSISFTGCVLNNVTPCANFSMTLGNQAWLKADRNTAHGGGMLIKSASFILSCGAGFKCKYEEVPHEAWFRTDAAKKAFLNPQGSLVKVDLMGEVGCTAKSAKLLFSRPIGSPSSSVWLSQ
jgi:hypothetical protein